MDPTPAITAIASNGLLGAVVIVVGWVAWSKDRELKAEREARINDAKNYTDLALGLQAKVLDAVNRLSDILDETKKLVPPGRFGRGA